MPDPFATAEEMSAYANMPIPADLARMQLLLRLASAEIRAYTGQVLSTVAADVVTLGPTAKRTLYLPERPVTAITTVLVSGVAVTAYSFTEDGNIVHGATPAAYSQESWPNGATVTYDHGYAEFSTEYERVKDVAIEVALNAFTMNERGVSEVLGTTVLETSGYSPAIFLTPEQKRKLDELEVASVG